jgi:hypothetical protein
MNRSEELDSPTFYSRAVDSNNRQAIQRRLSELRELFESDEIDAIWYIRLNRTLSTQAKIAVLGKIKMLLKYFDQSN